LAGSVMDAPELRLWHVKRRWIRSAQPASRCWFSPASVRGSARSPSLRPGPVSMRSASPRLRSSRNQRASFSALWIIANAVGDQPPHHPDWDNGNYTTQPRSARFASAFYGIATAGGTLAYQKSAPTREAADKLLDERLAAPFTADANDILYQWASSGDYDPSPGLERIQATVLAINSADDERNPPETGIMDRELKRIKNARLFLIPASEDTRGHVTAAFAKFWKQQVQELLATAPRRGT
jgi:hypothetical protein